MQKGLCTRPSNWPHFAFMDSSLWRTVCDSSPCAGGVLCHKSLLHPVYVNSHSRREASPVAWGVYVTGGRAAGLLVIHFLLFFLCSREHLAYSSLLSVLSSLETSYAHSRSNLLEVSFRFWKGHFDKLGFPIFPLLKRKVASLLLFVTVVKRNRLFYTKILGKQEWALCWCSGVKSTIWLQWINTAIWRDNGGWVVEGFGVQVKGVCCQQVALKPVRMGLWFVSLKCPWLLNPSM